MAVEYGTIAIVPKGEWNAGTQYEVANLVTKDGSSYVAHTKPPVGTLPTDTAYWQVSAQGGGKATADIPGVIKPDGITTEVDENAALSVKVATQETAGIVKGSAGIKVGADGSIDVDTTFTEATEFANIVAQEAIAVVLGKVSKAIATTMSLDQNALLKNMMTNIDVNDANKIPTSAYIHTLVERIGMGTDLTAGDNLTAAVENLNRDFEWKTGGTKTGPGVIQLPENFSELNIQCYAQSGDYRYSVTYHFVYAELMAAGMFYCAGYNAAGETAMFRIAVTRTTVSLISAYLGDLNVVSSTNVAVFYR